jgi:hypothetical protein
MRLPEVGGRVKQSPIVLWHWACADLRWVDQWLAQRKKKPNYIDGKDFSVLGRLPAWPEGVLGGGERLRGREHGRMDMTR